MDCEKMGNLICELRKGKGLTQKELGDLLHVSDKAVSKWERGLGCPEVSLLPRLSGILGVAAEKLLSGELGKNVFEGGNMKQSKFYICPLCGNLLISAQGAEISCCGRTLEASDPKKAEDEEKLSVERIENDYFITSEHEMAKEHHISFVALLTGDTLILRRQYPEWDLQVRIPQVGHGMLIWHCVKHGTFYQLV